MFDGAVMTMYGNIRWRIIVAHRKELAWAMKYRLVDCHLFECTDRWASSVPGLEVSDVDNDKLNHSKPLLAKISIFYFSAKCHPRFYPLKIT